MDEQSKEQNREVGEKKYYGKRPLWQWIIIYLVIGGILYLIIYFFFFRGSIGLPGY